MGLFQNLKALWIFKLWTIPFGFERFKPILKASRSPIFDSDLWFLKKIIFLSATTTFMSKSLRKSAWKSENSWKKWIFFNFFKIDICLIYDHSGVPNHFVTSETSFGSILMHSEAILERFSRSKFRPWKWLFHLIMLFWLLKQAICGVVSKSKGSLNFQVMNNPFRFWKVQTNSKSL